MAQHRADGPPSVIKMRRVRHGNRHGTARGSALQVDLDDDGQPSTFAIVRYTGRHRLTRGELARAPALATG